MGLRIQNQIAKDKWVDTPTQLSATLGIIAREYKTSKGVVLKTLKKGVEVHTRRAIFRLAPECLNPEIQKQKLEDKEAV
jgi:transposase